LKKTCDYLRKKYPEIPVIIDAKRADIGNTNLGYVRLIFEYLKADAETVNPYLDEEALAPFLAQKDKGIIVLCKTSNSGADEFQDLVLSSKY
jgi:orotidine-5'-phosphate decarboxylase